MNKKPERMETELEISILDKRISNLIKDIKENHNIDFSFLLEDSTNVIKNEKENVEVS